MDKKGRPVCADMQAGRGGVASRVPCLLFSGNNAWGMYNFRKNLLRSYVERGFRVAVSAPYDAEWFGKLEALGCEVYAVEMAAKGTNPMADLGIVWRYWKLLRRLRPNLSITYTIKPNIYGSVAAQVLGIPYLPVTTGLGYVFISETTISKIARALYRVAFWKAERVWFLNRDDIASFKRARLVAEERIEQLPGEGIDLSRFAFKPMRGRQNDGLTFLLVGRMLRDKGVTEFVEAARTVRERHPAARFLLLGNVWEANPAAISRKEIAAWAAQGVVEYCGATNDVRPYLEDADCVVLPSYREGVPCTLMEAAAVGRPLIATDVPGCREVVEHGLNGFLCEARSAESLAAAMELMIGIPAGVRARMGRCGRRLMEKKFDVEHVIARYDEALRHIMGSRGAR